MNTLTSNFAPHIEAMLEWRTSLGHSLRDMRNAMTGFDRFCSSHHPGETVLTRELATAWCRDTATGTWGAYRSRAVREFGKYLQLAGVDAFIVPSAWIASPTRGLPDPPRRRRPLRPGRLHLAVAVGRWRMTGTPRTSAGQPPAPVDETFHPSRYGCYELTRVYHVDGHVLRVRVYRDFYDFQSHAVTEVLTPQRTWTVVATAPWTQWHHTTPATAADAAPLTPVADDLLRRARHILHPPPAPPSAAAPVDR